MPNFRRRRILAVLLVVLVGLGGAAYLNRSAIRAGWSQLFAADFAGPGHGSVTFEVSSGDDGETITRNLVKAGVVKDFDTSYRIVLDSNPTFYPGTFNLKLEMSTRGALAVLTDQNAVVTNQVTVREGLRIYNVFKALSDATDLPVSDFESAAKDLTALGIPNSAPSAEGYLFPATYRFSPDATAAQILKQMVNRTYQELDSFGVAVKDRHKVLTLASIIEKEARQADDFYKVSRVFKNRLKINMPLQSDATVSYGSGGNTVTTTDAERADQNGYNTYVHYGLPIGPISAPGSHAIDAALHPADGNWIYFCAVNLKTGETVFSETAAQHSVAVEQFRAWIRANPGWNGS